MTFDEALPRLVAAYDQGVLVPFLGAGMSVDACPGWDGLITGLEQRAGIPPATQDTEAPDLVRRANRAVRVLKRGAQAAFIRALRATLYTPGKAIPDQTQALAKIWWPLVLTTNYDDHFVTAYNRSQRDERDKLTVLGRSPQDAQQVLSSLSSTSGCLIWALQGHLPRSGEHRLHAELVVGHAEYRRVTHTAQHFRRAFTEVFRRRSFLFLGSSLADTYLLDLFGEILEFAGANPLPHFAMVPRRSVDAGFLLSRYNIIALEFDGFEELPRWLTRLKEEIDGSGVRPVRWCYSLSAHPAAGSPGEDLQIVRGALPAPSKGEVLAVSVGTGGQNTLWVGKGVDETVRPFWPAPLIAPRGYAMERLGERFVFGYRNPDDSPVPVVAVNARVDEHDRRDLRLIGDAVWELLEWAAAAGFETVRMQVLSAGESAHYATRFSLAEAVRAYGRWKRKSPRALALRIHVKDRRALLEVAAGRLDVTELLTCDDVRFWVEIVDGEQVLEREMVFGDCDHPLSTLAAQFDVPRKGWELDVNPRPRRDTERHTVEKYWNTDLLSVGVIPGATLRFIAPEPQPARRR